VREGLLDDRLLQEDRDDHQLAAAVRAALEFELNHAVDRGPARIIN